MRLAAILHNTDRIRLEVISREINPQALDGFNIAHLTGTGETRFTPAQIETLRAFVHAGGTLIVDAAGGDTAFATAVENVLRQINPEAPLQILDRTHALYQLDPQPVQIAYRLAAVRRIGSVTEPRMRAMMLNDRPAVLYSVEDLSFGLTGAHADGVAGYQPETAVQLMRNMIRLATGP